MKLLIILLLTFQAFAIDVSPIKKDQPAPYDGFILDEANLKEMKTINEERKVLKKKVVTLEELGNIKDSKVKLYKEEADYYHKQAKKEESKSTWKIVGGILLGILATSAAGYVYDRTRK